MSKKDDEINRQLIFNSGGANPEDYLTPKQLQRYNENPEKFIDIDVDLAMNQEEEQNQPDPSQGVAAPDYSLDALLYSTVLPTLKLPEIPAALGIAGRFLKSLRGKDKVLQLQDDEQPLLSEQTFGTDSNFLTRFFGEVTPEAVKYLKSLTMKGEADETGIEGDKFNYGEDVLGNLPPKTLELLKKNKFTTNQSKLLVSNFNKPIPRDLSATIASLFNTVDDFNRFKQTMLPVYLESMSKVRRTKTPQADHIAQLRAALPFFYGKPVELWPQISDIIVKEGVFGLGHNNKNLVFLEFPVHTVKTAFWKEQVGDAGEKFFAGRTLDTPDQIRAAAKEFAEFIRQSNKVVNDAVEQYNFMNQKQIDQAELVEFIDRLGANPLEAKYSIKQVKDILKQMEEDGFKATSKESQAAETKVIKSEQKTAKDKKARQDKIDQEFQKSVVESETYRKYYASDEDKFKSPYVKGLKDDMLITHAEDIYEEMTIDKNPETKNATINAIKKILKKRFRK